MKPLNLGTQSVSLCMIAFIGLVGCNQPNSIQANASTLDTQSSYTQIAQTISADDAADRVENALENDSTLKPFDLDADDEGDAIVIEGTVRNAAQKALAEDIAKRTAPDFTIINRINVR